MDEHNKGGREPLRTNRPREDPVEDPAAALPAATPPPEALGDQQLEHPPNASSRYPPEASVWKDLGSLGIKVGVIAGIALLLFTFVYGLHYNVDPSMNPSVKDGDLVVYYRWDKDYKAGDLLLLKFQGQTQVRRVVAIEGDRVDITESGLMVNGAIQQERDIFRATERYEEGIDFPVTLGRKEVFVLGDAREGVTDSRIYGAVHTDDTEGTVIALLRRRNI